MTRSGPIARALAAALRKAPVADSDVTGVALAKRYAALLDDSAPAAKYSKALDVLGRLVADSDDDACSAAFRTIAVALSAHSTASDLGPKLKDLLTALELTPAGRKIIRSEERTPDVDQPAPAPAGGTDELERLRAERIARQRRT